MSITIGTSTMNGRYVANLPDAGAISVPAVAKAAVAAKEAEAEYRASMRERDAAVKAVEVAEGAIAAQAAELKIKKKKLGADILAPFREAKDVAELAQIDVDASSRAFEHSFSVLAATVEANREALIAAAQKDAYMALQRLGAAKMAFVSAADAAHASYGLLGMFSELDRTGETKLTLRDPQGSRRGFFVGQAITAIDEAVGHSALALDAFKRGTAPTKKELEAVTHED